MLGPRTPADEARNLQPCLQWVKRGCSDDVRSTSASPLNSDDLKRRQECLRGARSGH